MTDDSTFPPEGAAPPASAEPPPGNSVPPPTSSQPVPPAPPVPPRPAAPIPPTEAEAAAEARTAEQPAVSATDPTTPMSAIADAGRGVPPMPPAAPPAGPAPTGSPAPPTPPRRGRRAVTVLTAAGLMVASATGGALLALGLDDNGNSSTPAATSSLTPAATTKSDSAPDEPLSRAAAKVLPSVVSITFDANQGQGTGSGVIISSDGEILTNNHVVAEVADGGGSLSVTFANGKKADAKILGRDPATDLAVIKADGVSGLTPAKLGSSSALHVGDTVLAIGSPLGLDGSVTSGIVSALNRSITLDESPQESPFGNPGQSGTSNTAVIDAIQTDAAINPGNSGGALANADGEVVGINTAIASLAGGAGVGSQSGNIGVGFAIPIDEARSIANQLIEKGQVNHAYLGVSIADAESGNGAVIGGVQKGQPAAKAGLQEGDVITKVGDQAITDAASLTSAIRSHEPGDRVTITYTRNGDKHTTEVTLGQLPTD